MIDENSLIVWIIGLIGTIITVAVVVIQRMSGNTPIIKLLDDYKKNAAFIASDFSINEDHVIIGEINGIAIELSPRLKEAGGMAFTLIIDLTGKSYYNNPGI